MPYSTTSDTAWEVCKKLQFNFECRFVTAMKIKNKIYVGFTCGKPDEIRALAFRAENAGYILSRGLKHTYDRL